jgi:nitrite reductase/ring-hydroxylating ferredoxin subunit
MTDVAQTTTRPPAGVRLCALDDLQIVGTRGFRFGEGRTQFAGFLVRTGRGVHGYVDSCPHAGWRLSATDDYLNRDRTFIVCAGHGALFRVGDAVGVTAPCDGAQLDTWPVEVREGEVFTA